MKVAFKSGRSFHSVLTKVKDPMPIKKHSKVVYLIPCSCACCGKAYIGKTRRRLKDQAKGTPGHVLERDIGEVGGCRICMGEPPPRQIGGYLSG